MKFSIKIIGVSIACVLGFLAVNSHAKSPRILMLLWQESAGAERGFKDTIAEKLPDKKIKYTVFNIHKNIDLLHDFLTTARESDYNLVYTYGSQITSKVAENYQTVPIVFNIVYDPIGYKIIESWDKKQHNLTGVSNSISTNIQLQKIEEVVGKGSIGFIYNPLDRRALESKKEMESYLTERGYELISFEFQKNYRPLNAYLKRIKNSVTCIYISSDWQISKHIKRILSRINRRRIPTCVTSLSYLNKGAFLCISAEYYKMGKIAGDSAVKILQGTKPLDLPVQRPSPSDINLFVSAVTLRKLNIQLPKNVDIHFIQ
ncbi:MAG: ABC transporter substrate-binding protein [bacterium]